MNKILSTGLTGLDKILDGGLIANRSYMIRGKPGTGKTILGLNFLLEGVKKNENVLFINLGEPEENIKEDAEALGMNLDDVEFLDMSPHSDFFSEKKSYDLFPADEVEGDDFAQQIIEKFKEVKPRRVLVDPLTQFRYLTSDEYQFRKQVLSFLKFMKENDSTVLFTSQNTATEPDDDLQFMSDGVINLYLTENGRGINITKIRGSKFRSGQHSMKIDDSGMIIYPEIMPKEHSQKFTDEKISSGIEKLDNLLYGGIERGTVTIISGPSGVGKTTTGTQFICEAASREERSAIYLFEEEKEIFLHRATSIGMPIRQILGDGHLKIEEIEPLKRSTEEFAHMVMEDVEDNDTKVILIDGTSGYELSLVGQESAMRRKLHALCKYLKRMGVTVLLINETSEVIGEFQPTEKDMSYLADNILFLRYLEMQGEMRKAIGVLKKRASDFERTLREFEITSEGIKLGDPLNGLRGILKGVPNFIDVEDSK